eukprot:3329888-Rhodomonas_salina.1
MLLCARPGSLRFPLASSAFSLTCHAPPLHSVWSRIPTRTTRLSTTHLSAAAGGYCRRQTKMVQVSTFLIRGANGNTPDAILPSYPGDAAEQGFRGLCELTRRKRKARRKAGHN